jgi:PKD repeat protein
MLQKKYQNILGRFKRIMRKKISIATIFIIIISAFFIAFNPVTLADPLINVTATPTDNTADVSTTYTIVFTTITPLTVATIPDRIVITFLTGFDASGAAVDGATGTQSGFDPVLVSATATIVTLDVAADEAVGTQSIVLSGIINTQTAGTGKTVNVETQDGDNTYAILDGPTPSAAFAIAAGPVATLTVQTQPSAAVAGTVIAPPIKIAAKDAFNNVVPGASVAVVLQTGTGTLSGTTPQTSDVSGIASFNDLSIDMVGVDKVLRFASNGQTVDSAAFTISTVDGNLPPILGLPTPSNDSINILLSLNWSIPINDSDGNAFTWTIQCNNRQNNSATSDVNGTKSLALAGLAYSTPYTVWVNATDPNGSGLYTRKWYTFTTKSYDGGGGGGGGGGGQPDPQNKKPVANASAGEPYQGFVNVDIFFNGSKSYDPDGNITKWFWVFGDNTNGTGKTIRHPYPKAGTYTVTLTVTDNKGATNTDQTTCVIKQSNRPPTKPIIYGPLNGKKNIFYNYTAVSSDPDNDMIQYTFDWGDSLSISQLSGFLPNASSYTFNHGWIAAGRYKVTVIVSDNQTTTSSNITIYIDAMQARGAGYLLDYDGDGIYDAFNSDVSHLITVVGMKDDTYLIDGDGDRVWDYMYNESSGITSYPLENTPGFEIVGIVGAMMIVLLYRRKRKHYV